MTSNNNFRHQYPRMINSRVLAFICEIKIIFPSVYCSIVSLFDASSVHTSNKCDCLFDSEATNIDNNMALIEKNYGREKKVQIKCNYIIVCMEISLSEL